MTRKSFIYFLIFIINFNFIFIHPMQINSVKSHNLKICHILWPFIEIIFKGRDKYKDFCYEEELKTIVQHVIYKLIEYANTNLSELNTNLIDKENPKLLEIPECLIKDITKGIKADLYSCIRYQNQSNTVKKILEYNLHNKICKLPVIKYLKRNLKDHSLKCIIIHIPISTMSDIAIEDLKNLILIKNYSKNDILIKDICLLIKSRLNTNDFIFNCVSPETVLKLYQLFKVSFISVDFKDTDHNDFIRDLIFTEITQILTQDHLLKKRTQEYNTTIQPQDIIIDIYKLFFKQYFLYIEDTDESNSDL